MDTPDTHPTMMILKVKIDATKLSFTPTMEELANYLATRLIQEFRGATYQPRPIIANLTDLSGNRIGEYQVQDGRQPFPE